MARRMFVWMVSLAFACSGDDVQEEDTDLVVETGDNDTQEPTGDVVAGGELFLEHCANCHGADGVSGTAPDLPDTARNYSDEELVTLIRYGWEYMPAHDFNRTQLDDVVAYVRVTFP